MPALRALLVSGLVLMLVAATPEDLGAQPSSAPGGFVEPATSPDVRPRVTPALPSRGKFTFPTPYNTTGIRLTNASDCGDTDCVQYIGYSYWRNMNNHVGSNTMLIFLTLDKNRGGGGPTLFTYDKTTDQVTVSGPLFDASHPLSWATGEGWYFSATHATKLYVNDGPRLYRYDVLSKQFEMVFDVSTQFGSDKYIWQVHSSSNDLVHSATLRRSGDWATLGCVVYNEVSGLFSYFLYNLLPFPVTYYPAEGVYDECQVDKSGRWLLIKDNVDGLHGEDNVILDLLTGLRTTFLDPAGAAGHSDNGFGYMVAQDNWNSAPGAVRLWMFGQPFPSSQPGTAPQGRLVYRTTDWAADIGHIAHSNAKPGAPPAQQYACGGNARREELPRNNEIVCFRLDGSLQVLVVAPIMTDLDAPGGGEEYAKLPKGNLDVTGQYFIWTSNVGGNRLDAFIVKVPAHLL